MVQHHSISIIMMLICTFFSTPAIAGVTNIRVFSIEKDTYCVSTNTKKLSIDTACLLWKESLYRNNHYYIQCTYKENTPVSCTPDNQYIDYRDPDQKYHGNIHTRYTRSNEKLYVDLIYPPNSKPPHSWTGLVILCTILILGYTVLLSR